MNNQLLKLYESMKRIRMVESAIADNYNNEIREMHTPIHLYDGQEAVAVGVCSQLSDEDVIFSNHRCHGLNCIIRKRVAVKDMGDLCI